MSSPGPQPVRPPRVTPKKPDRTWLSLALASGLLFLVGVVAASLPLGYIGPALVIGGALFLIVATAHYLIWGKWVAKVLEDERRRQEIEDE